ncbi:chorismate mutase [Cysteiniphilum litorale]|uniref:chorismate mutase n=2 Tax=Fastidiosibacteraceae TaxID=2056687 RepID=A0A8J2Z1L3_9GAMM|nr:chorismate mutase [Cysteiniphilum litorale]
MLKIINKVTKVCFMAVVLTGVSQASDCDSSKLTNAFNLIAKRAEVMQLVAADKYSDKTSIYAPAREIQVLQNVQAIANKENLPLYPTLMFSQLQMDMSKFIEQYWLDKWLADPKSFDHKDLDLTKLRATISSVDKSLYPAIKDALPSLKRCSLAISSKAFKAAMNKVEGVPSNPDYVNMMLASLVAISQAQQ